MSMLGAFNKLNKFVVLMDILRQDVVGIPESCASAEVRKLVGMDKGDKVLGAQKSERDLGVIMQSDLKVNKQCSKAANEANKRLGMINRNLKCKAKKVILPLYKSIVRPHLDYCVQSWRPHYRRDIDKLEKVQKRATRMVEGR